MSKRGIISIICICLIIIVTAVSFMFPGFYVISEGYENCNYSETVNEFHRTTANKVGLLLGQEKDFIASGSEIQITIYRFLRTETYTVNVGHNENIEGITFVCDSLYYSDKVAGNVIKLRKTKNIYK